ncbi:hypothetical protein [Myroides fluvii]|uniref:hypothetical protein n=1 Tax=Myroides fluvii TaxID=2572594 RepID=UPI00131A826D|nr:hypothetical protein [Myroides fluvii]
MKKYLLLLVFFLLVGTQAFASSGGNAGILGGVGLGTIIAIVASWSRNKSVLWAIIHGLLGWIYVIYFVLTPSKNK